MEREGGEKETIITQVSMGGFGRDVKAKDLMQILEDQIGMVDRCRLKTSWTAPESYPNFDDINREGITDADETKRVEPHAFVHFASPRSAARALEASDNNQLMMDDRILRVTVGPKTPYRMNQMRRMTFPIKLSDVVLEIGTLVSRDDFFVAWRGPRYGVHFLVDPFDGTCKFCFSMDTAFSFKGILKLAMMKCDFKVEFLVRDINEIKQYTDTSYLVVLLHLASSPRVLYRTAEDDIEVSVPFNLLDDDDPWIRTTDFTRSGAIGRCNFYRVSIPPRHGGKLKKAMNYFQERRVRETSLRRPLRIQDEPNFGISKPDPFFCFQHENQIPFEVMFLVNVAVHKGIFNEHQIADDFFGLLRSHKTEVNVAALKHISSYKRPVFDAYKRLKLVQEWLLRDPKALKDSKPMDDLTEVRRLVITPTRAYCLPPEVELSNRVLRKYKDVADRFLRVTFMDEGMQSMNWNVLNFHAAPIVKELTSNSFPQKTIVFSRVKTLLNNGFYVCGRKYSFLAFSSNQLRDQSAWFVAEQSLNVQKIHRWMGEFNNRNVAMCAARMGLCFSSTYATVEVPEKEVNFDLPDIKWNNYVFSDGIGMITPDLAMEVAKRLKLDVNPPSAYQIRYAGCKGVIACWPSKSGDQIRLSLRPSMNKFKSKHTMLEICSWTRFQPGFLNRQFVTLLSSLNVPDEVFWMMQETMVMKLTRMLEDADVAFDILTGSCAAEQGNDSAIMLSAGFSPKSEPHLRGMLTCIRAAQLWGLREKARIFVPSGRWLMGCLDELGVLEQGQCFVQVSTPSLENCFHKHGSRFSETRNNLEVIKGYVVIAKNPCLHPGDVRVLEAVDSPRLHHLYDCLVFPQKGDRPHTDEASGSDLDGDLYFVTWDENLIPPSKKSWPPMEYNPALAKEMKRPITTVDIKEFFVRNMVNENLGSICNAHVVHADLSENGAMDEKCLKLAGLAATAVDFPKTGVIVPMPADLKPKLYPDFMGKEAYQSYKSTKILGRLYRHITDSHDADAAPSFELSVSYDANLGVPGSADFVGPAWDHKCSYDGQVKALMLQYKVTREEEVVTGQIWSMPKYNSRKQGDLKERLKHAYSGLKKEYRQKFESLDPEFDKLSDEERNTLYEKKASAWYQVTYGPEWLKKAREAEDAEDGDDEVPPRLSFAWIATDYLARIKIRSRGVVDSAKPIDSLGKYLADRI